MYDGQLRLCAWTSVASGAAMVEYWHWHSLHYGQETYWRGVLGHDLEPNRTYGEVSKIGAEFRRHGPRVVLDRKDNRVAILVSLDSNDGLRFMPVSDRVSYISALMQMWQALWGLNVETDVIAPDVADWSRYKVLLVPPLYVADDALLQRIAEFVKNGGHAVVAFKSGFTNEHSTVRWAMAPGPLREAAGIRYQEFTTLAQPLGLTPDVFRLGGQNQASVWAEMVIPEKARTVLSYTGDFLGKYAAVTRNEFGKGTLTYEAAFVSDELQRALVGDAVKRAELAMPSLPAGVKLRQGFNAKGETVRFYLNFSGERKTVAGVEGESLLEGRASKGPLELEPWGVAVLVK
jgi:beta-galactosidase